MKHDCAHCGGRGWVCPACGRPHPKRGDGWGFKRRCYSRAKPIRCPGFQPTPDETGLSVPARIPHFESFTECDVCKLRVPGDPGSNFLRAKERPPPRWHLDNTHTGTFVTLCPCCSLRLWELRHTVFDRLVEERGEVHAGRWHGGLVRLQVIR